MTTQYVVMKPDDMKKPMEFSKFMHEILETEKKKGDLHDDEEGNFGRKIIQKSTERPINNIRWRR